MAFAMVILVLAFGSVLAMGLPISVALAGISVGTITVGLLSNLITIPDFATQLGLMIGLGVGIDYALFIVTRFREQLHAGDDIGPAVRKSIDTAGRAVAFAGTTVVISLLGMLVMQISFVSGLAIGAAVVVLMTMVAALTLLPALLGFAGEPGGAHPLAGPDRAPPSSPSACWASASRSPSCSPCACPLAVIVLLASLAVRPLRQPVPRPAAQAPQRDPRLPLEPAHPAPPVAVGASARSLLLILLALPVFGLRLGFSDEGNYAEETTTRKAYDLLAEGFGPGFNGTMLVVSEVPAGHRPTPPCSGSPTP